MQPVAEEIDHRSNTAPSLRRRLIVQIGLVIVGLILLGAAALWGINGLHHDYGGALQGYQQLRTAYEIGFQVATARGSIAEDPPQAQRALASMQTALTRIETADEISRQRMQPLRADLIEAENAIRAGAADGSRLDPALARIASLSTDIRQGITASQDAANQKRRFTLAVVLGICAAVLIGGVIIGIRQYRGVMRPIARLSDAARSIATGNFSRRIPTAGDDREFAALANDFNGMAAELESLYRDLDEKVAVKSKQLLRSERLASVGFLAAGVAHEINNPLGIIAGFGERAIQQLDDPRSEPATHLAQARKALSVICEEAFRCKGITDRLLSLARPGDETRTRISLASLASEVISNVGALAQYADRRIKLEIDPPDDLVILANQGEMKQVILNLLVNALEAVAPGTGQVWMKIARRGGEAELSIRDDGRGMSPQTLEHVFEPFFTDKRNDGRGTGLGLSITHAIVTAHGGSIHAESDGVGQGSCFVVRLPAAKDG